MGARAQARRIGAAHQARTDQPRSENRDMAGALTVTSTGVAALKPAAVALTAVDPPPIGSNSTPPVATVVGEKYAPTGTVTVGSAPRRSTSPAAPPSQCYCSP